MYEYYREKLHVHNFCKLKGKEALLTITFCAMSLFLYKEIQGEEGRLVNCTTKYLPFSSVMTPADVFSLDAWFSAFLFVIAAKKSREIITFKQQVCLPVDLPCYAYKDFVRIVVEYLRRQ